MRSEQTMFQLIIKEAEQNKLIRAVYMNGSRTNPNVPKDILQDYDIVFVVEDTKAFYEDSTWINRFGEILYMQMPEYMDKLSGHAVQWEDTFGWLMLFSDGNRLDPHVNSIEYAKANIRLDKLCEILLDKDRLFPDIAESTDVEYHVKKPDSAQYLCVCNEFWWCLNNVAKGLWRDEIPYVMDMLNAHVRPQLCQILSWKIGVQTNFSCSVGKSGKYMSRYLSTQEWEMFLRTYSSSDTEEIWKSVFTMCDLFRTVAVEVAGALKIQYNYQDEQAARRYFEFIRTLSHETVVEP